VIAIDATTGDWTYDLDQTAADVLAQDENVVETFIASITDGGGAVGNTTVEVTITGSNDGPVITSDAPQETLSESITGFNTLEPVDEEAPDPVGVEGDGPADAGSVTGALSFFDVDQGDTPGQWSVVADAVNTTALGAISIDAPTGVWVYTLDERAADVLGNGDMVTETFTATVTDAFGATASQQIAITVTGFNDAPTIEFSIEDIEATVFEDGFDPEAAESALPALLLAAMEGSDASGTLRYTDPDGQPGDIAAWTIAPDGPSLGSMVIDALTGEWHYTLDEAAAQSLREGEEVIETFTATVTDTLGAAAQQTITITVIGANDESEIIATAQDLTGAAADGGVSTASGTLTFSDPDAAPGEVALWSVSPVGDTRGSMTIDPDTGAWLYTLDQSRADSLGQGAQVDEFFTARLTDGLGATSDQIITITLTGENDAPVITQAQSSGIVVEAGAAGPGSPQATGDITAVDPDEDGAIPIWTLAIDATNTTNFGAMIIDPVTGTWTYTLDEAAAQALTTGDSFVERFVATVTDPFGGSASQDIDVTIEGTNYAPVVLNGSGTALESGPQVTVDLSLLASDVDAGEDGSTLNYALVGNPTQGSAQIVGTNLIFTPGDDFAVLAAGETTDVVVNFTATDAGGISVPASVTITVTGTNSAPSFAANATADVAENAASLTVDLAVLGADPDAGEDGATLIYALVGSPAQGSAQIVGTDLIFAPGSDFLTLAAGETALVVLNLTATDAGGASVSGSVTITVTGTNSVPELAGTSLSLSEDTGQITLDLSTLGSDPDAGEDGSTLNYTITGAPAAGSASINGTTLSFGTDGAFDTLGQGETRTVAITVTAADAAGETATATVEVTVTGTNDAPQITQTSAVTTGAVREDGTISGTATATGQLAYTDADETAPGDAIWTISPQNGPFGAMSIGSGSGDWLYTLDNTTADSLNAGETRTETFTATVTDAAGATDSQIITITITGTNDAPLLNSTSENIDADTPSIVIALDALASDPDSADTDATLSYAIARAPEAGTLTLTGDTLRFAVGTDFDSLPDGQTQTVTFDIRVTDSNGASTVTEMSVVVTGTQTAPEITSNAVQAQGSVTEDVTLTTGGTLGYDDPDAATPTSGVWSVLPAATALGSIEINAATGVWLYTLDETAADSLNAGETRTESFTATITDADGLNDTQDITVTVTGSNDAPSLSAQTTALLEDDVAVTLDLRANAADTDSGDTAASLSFAVVSGPAAGIASVTGGTLRFDPDGAFDDLATGETRAIFVDVEVRDAQGATAVTTYQFDVTGTNDAPTIELANSTITGTAVEPTTAFDTAGGPDATGTLAYIDVDEPVNAPGTWSVAPVGPGYGSLEINASTGVWAYVVDGSATNFLRQGATVEDRFTATITDADGATATQDIILTITGTNDRPEVNATTSATTGAHTEEGVLVATGQLFASDPDDAVVAATWGIAVDTGLGGNAFGSMSINATTGVWTYNTNPNAVAPLGAGDTEVEHYTATVTDEFGATDTITVAITINGTNTAPEIVATASQIIGTVVEAGTLTPGNGLARATLDYVDIDEGTTPGTWSVTATGAAQFGTATIGATSGQWVYTLAQVLADSLGAGQTATDTFSVIYTDAEGAASEPQQITITLQGSNDVALITGATTGSVFEDAGAASTVSGNLNHTDIDANNPNDSWQTATNAPSDQGFGTYQINGQGVWTYTLDNANPTINALPPGQTRQDTFTATTQDGTPQIVTITITGENDAPVMIAGNGTASEDDEGIEFDLETLGSDVDSDDTAASLTYAIVTPPAFGTATISNGTLSIAPGSDFEDLAAGEERVVTVGVRATDSNAATSNTVDVNITVTGTNDAPEFLFASAAGIQELLDTSNSTTIRGGSGSNTFSDIDLSDVGHTATITNLSLAGVAVGLPSASVLESYLTLNTTKLAGASTGIVDWSFAAQDSVFDYLAGGEAVTLRYDITVDDGDGGSDTFTLPINIIGANDLPFYTAPLGDFEGNEDSGLQSINLLAGAVDLDNGETPGIAGAPIVQPGISIASNQLFVDFDNAAFQDLSLGETRAIVVNYGLTDGSGTGAFTPAAVNVIVTGVNDAPTLAAGTGAGAADAATIDVDLSLLGDDIDSEDDGSTLTYTIITGPAEGSAVIPVGTTTLQFDPGTDFFDLGSGNSRDVTVQIQATDTRLATSTIETVTITVNGISTPATITGDMTGSVVEDGAPGTASGDLDSVDPDIGDADDAWNATSGPVATTYGTYEIGTDGTWDYTLSNGSAAVNALDDGDTVFDIFTVNTTDGTPQDITITITGSNDDADITGALGMAVNEVGFTGAISGNLFSTDVDADDADNSWTVVSTPTATVSGEGTFTFSALGNWTYAANPLNLAIDGLNVGDTFNDSFTISTTDGTEQVIAIEIQGFNDAATIGGVITGSVDEDDVNDTISGIATSMDVDNTDDAFLVQGATATLSGRGTFSVNAGGTWSYTLNNANTDVNELLGGETLGDLFTIASEDGTQQIINITINGNNDTPVIGGDIAGSLIEDDPNDIFTGQLTITDPDGPAQTWVAESLSLPISGAGFSIDAAGMWNYSINNASSAVDGLSVGETFQEGYIAGTTGGLTQLLTVTITGVNDTPMFTEAGFAVFSETAGTSNSMTIRSVSDTQAFTDVDLSDIGHSASVEVRSLSGVTNGLPTDATLESYFTLTPTKNAGESTGQVAWQFDAPDNVFDYLPQGQSVTMQFWISANDGDGGNGRANATVQVNGSNDLPFYTTALSPLAGNEDSGTASIDLLTGAADLDFGETAGLTITDVTGLEPGITFTGSTLTADFSDAAFQDLAQGEVRTITINYNLSDSGTTATPSSIDVVITGVNDAPETTLAIENITLNAPIDTTQPAWTEFNGHFYQFVDLPTGLTWGDAQIAANATGGYLANVTSSAENAFLVGLSSGLTGWIGGTDADVEDVWIWSQGPEAGQQFFQGAAVGDGGTGVGGFYTNWRQSPLVEPNEGIENALQFTGDGTWNNLVDSPAQILDYFLEYSGPPAFRGTLAGSVSDAEGDGLTFTSLVAVPNPLTINPDGTWVFDQTQTLVTQVSDGVTVQQNYSYEVTDGTSTTIGTLRFDFTGINDAAVITGDTSGTILENVAGGTLTGNLGHTDVDLNNANDVWIALSEPAEGGYGEFSMNAAGEWTYTLNNNSAVNSLNVGDNPTDSFTVQTEDGTEQTITITIQGEDDPGAIGGDLTATILEDDVPNTVGGTVQYTDVDGPNIAINGGNFSATYGNFTINGAGVWSYTLFNGSGAVQALNVGDTLTDAFNITTVDFNNVTPITVTIQGVDDPATITGDIVGTVIEDVTAIATGDLNHVDVDNVDQVFNTVTGAAAGFGTYDVDTAGNWTYTLDNGNTAVDDLNDSEAIIDSFTVTTNGGTPQVVNVTINGTTDTPAAVAVNDVGLVETINVMVVGELSSEITATREQLTGIGPGTDNYNFTVQTRAISADTLWNPTTLVGIDVVVLGGSISSASLDGRPSYGFIEQYYLAGGNVVTTGGILTQYFSVAQATEDKINAVSPVGDQSAAGGTNTTSSVVLNTANLAHPILDGITDFTLTPSFSYTTQQIDGSGVTNLASAGGAPALQAIVVKPGEMQAGTPGNAVFLGLPYLDGLNNAAGASVSLRSGTPDLLLEQAIAWAAGVNENVPFLHSATSLLANDTNAAGATITAVSPLSALGATVSLIGGNVNYLPVTSRALDELDFGEVGVDTFTYTITDGGGNTSTATVTVNVNGVTDTDAPPVLNLTSFDGFSAQNSSRYDFDFSRYSDADEMTGMQYVVQSLAAPNAALPTGFTFDTGTNSFTVTAAATVSYVETLILNSYEADGQSAVEIFGYSVDSTGDLRFVFTRSAGSSNGVLEIAFDDNPLIGAGDVAGDGELVDLTGIAAFAPSVLETTDILDIENDQENQMLIDTAELLTFFDGLPAAGARQVTIEGDSYDTVLTDQVGPGWEAFVTPGTVGNPDVITYESDGTQAASYGADMNVFLTLTIDGGDAAYNVT
jgi:VCBS repeat-containing protein